MLRELGKLAALKVGGGLGIAEVVIDEGCSKKRLVF
jgi:hypothetical protein